MLFSHLSNTSRSHIAREVPYQMKLLCFLKISRSYSTKDYKNVISLLKLYNSVLSYGELNAFQSKRHIPEVAIFIMT